MLVSVIKDENGNVVRPQKGLTVDEERELMDANPNYWIGLIDSKALKEDK